MDVEFRKTFTEDDAGVVHADLPAVPSEGDVVILPDSGVKWYVVRVSWYPPSRRVVVRIRTAA